jgi:hypothetical protein
MQVIPYKALTCVFGDLYSDTSVKMFYGKRLLNDAILDDALEEPNLLNGIDFLKNMSRNSPMIVPEIATKL